MNTSYDMAPKFLAKVLFLVALLSSCRSNISPGASKRTSSISDPVMSPQVQEDSKALKILLTGQTLPNCDSTSMGAVFYVVDEKTFKYCDANIWSAIDLRGERGEKGEKGNKGDNGVKGENGINMVAQVLPSDINDLSANGVANGEFAKRMGGAWIGSKAVEHSIYNSAPKYLKMSQMWRDLPIGTSDLSFSPAIPPGNKLVVPTGITLLNISGATTSFAIRLVRGTDISTLFGAPTNVVSGQPSGFATAQSVFYPGDSLQVFTSQIVSLAYVGWLVPDDDLNLKPFVNFLNEGENTIYSCPAGKIAIVGKALDGSSSGGLIRISNSSGATRNYVVHVVPNGGSPNASNWITKWGTGLHTTGLTISYSVFTGFLTAGESLVIVTDGAGPQMAYGVIYEIDDK